MDQSLFGAVTIDASGQVVFFPIKAANREVATIAITQSILEQGDALPGAMIILSEEELVQMLDHLRTLNHA